MPDETDQRDEASERDERSGRGQAPAGGDRRNEGAPRSGRRTEQSTGRSPELGDDRQFFEPGRPGNLADQADLTDAEGDDIREYTGEPVETEDGWVIPQQQNVGPGNEAGGGEFPAEPGDAQEMP
jgi:hypothetical protein